MHSPQQIIADYKSDKYLEKNREFIFPAYQSIYNDLVSQEIAIPESLVRDFEMLDDFFKMIVKNKRDNIDLIPKEKINEARIVLNSIVRFIVENRTNINNLEFLCWPLFNVTTLEALRDQYLDKYEEIESALLNPIFLKLLFRHPDFGSQIIRNVLVPIEFKRPSRMQGSFGDHIFARIADEIKKIIPGFKILKKGSIEELRTDSNWLITEKGVKKIGFPKPETTSKEIDMVCKINRLLFIASHKEQKQGGGGQDNQANDASHVFRYSDETEQSIKEKLNVEKIYYCIFLEGHSEVITSKHWLSAVSQIEDPKNRKKYLLNSFQFIQLIKSIKKV